MRRADVVDRSKVISRERASERRADLTELPLDQSLRVVIGAQVSSINRTPAVGGSYIARIPKRFVIDRQTSDGYHLDESNETTHRRATIQRQAEGLMEGTSRQGDGNKGSGDARRRIYL